MNGWHACIARRGNTRPRRVFSWIQFIIILSCHDSVTDALTAPTKPTSAFQLCLSRACLFVCDLSRHRLFHCKRTVPLALDLDREGHYSLATILAVASRNGRTSKTRPVW